MRLPPASHRLAIFVLLFSATIFWGYRWTRDIPHPGDEDLATLSERLPPESNALTPLGEAVKHLQYPPDNEDATDRIDLAILGEAWDEAWVASLLEQNRAALGHFARARATPGFQVRVRSTHGERRILSHWLMLAKLRALESRAEGMRGQQRVAMEHALELAHFGTRVRELDGGRMPHYLLGASVVRVALAALQRILIDVPLEPEEARLLAREIEGLRVDADGWARIARGAYQWSKGVLDESVAARGGNPPRYSRDPFARAVLDSMLTLAPDRYSLQRNRTLRRLADHYRLTIAAADAPCRELDRIAERQGGAPRAPMATTLERNALGIYWADIARSSIDVYRRSVCVSESMLSAVELMVALRAYAGQRGQMPASLDALVPDYFEEVPRDYFDGAPLRYAADRHLLYSVGSDFADAMGQWQPGQACTAELAFPIPFAVAGHAARPPARLTCEAPQS